MIFASHNFTANFLNAVGYKDKFMADQIIIDEVARLIVDDKKNVVEALRKSGVNATYQDNNDLIKSMLVKEIEDENAAILKFLSDRIIQNQFNENKFKELAAEAKINATGTTGEKSSFIQNVGKILQDENVKSSVSDLITTGIKNLFSKKNKEKTSNDQQLSERLKINEMKAASTAKKSKKGLLIFLAVLSGAVIIGGVVFFMVRKKYANGGIIESQITTTGGQPPVNAVT
jgi:predicted transcriptional regulator with HTH domain